MYTNSTPYPVYKSSTDGVPIRVSGRIIGAVRSGVFCKSVFASRHFLRVPPAIAFDVSALRDAERVGAVCVEVFDHESSKTSCAPIALIWERGFRVHRGFGEQIALALNEFQIKGEALQLNFFEEVRDADQ